MEAGFYNPYHGHPFHQKLEMTEITMSSELFLAPEMMYTSLDLPERVAEATKDLPDPVLKDLLSNILITGKEIENYTYLFRGNPETTCKRALWPNAT